MEREDCFARQAAWGQDSPCHGSLGKSSSNYLLALHLKWLELIDIWIRFLQVLFQKLVAEERHGGLAYAVRGQALQQYPFRSFKNTCITVIKIDERGNGVVERYNDYAHLESGASGIESADVVA